MGNSHSLADRGLCSLKYAFYALCVICLMTLLMAFGFPLMDTNFSVIGNRGGRRPVFLLWGLLTGNYFYLYTDSLADMAGCRDRIMRAFLLGALILFITAVGIPYLPERLPGLSRLHVQISFLAPLFLGAAQVRFLLLLQKRKRGSFCLQWFFLLFLGLGSAALFAAAGIVSSLLEIFVIFGACLYLVLLHYKIKNNSYCSLRD